MMGFFSAVYKNGEIRGCDEGTLVYVHEMRHKIQDDNSLVRKVVFISELLVYAGEVIMFGAFLRLFTGDTWDSFTSFLLVGAVFCMVHFTCVLCLEVDAWIYAFRVRWKK